METSYATMNLAVQIDAQPLALPSVHDLGNGARARWLSDRRLFLQHGPINLILRVEGEAAGVNAAYRSLMRVFPTWLTGLVKDLELLRRNAATISADPSHPISNRMLQAARAHRDQFVTPMAAVAGAVADEAVWTLLKESGVRRVWVNNGGDIAFEPAPGSPVQIGVVPSVRVAMPAASLSMDVRSPVRGVATSGWEGRSHSLGIADAVTVLAASAAAADVAATLIANAVNADHPAIVRTAAIELDERSDLGRRLVTTHVGFLDLTTVNRALERGAQLANALLQRGTIVSAALVLKGQWRVVEGETRLPWSDAQPDGDPW